MRAVIQRVTKAAVSVEGSIVGKIDSGLLVLLGVTHTDTEQDAKYLAEKICNLRIFEDENKKLNLSVLDTGGKILSVSQFTLYGDCRKGGDLASLRQLSRRWQISFIDNSIFTWNN